MRVRKYHDGDYATLESWSSQRGLPMIKRAWLPKRGWIVDNVTCFFLIKTDCKIGYLENFISNPKANVQDVAKAIDMMIPECERVAKELGIEAIIGYSWIPNVFAHGLRCGYFNDGKPYYQFSKILKEKTDVRRTGEQCSTDSPSVNQ